MRRNNGITALRGIFIMMIVLHHLNLYDGGGSLGVAFFFMLGGLALSMGYYDKVCLPDFSYTSFIKKRCKKFYPLHWLCLLAILPLSLLPVFKGAADIELALATLLPNALLLQSLIPIKSIYFSYNAVSWYLSVTMILAFAYPFIVRGLCKLSRNGKIAVLIMMLFAYATMVYFLPIEHRHAILYINPCVRVVDFMIGIYLYLLYKELSSEAASWSAIGSGWMASLSVTMFIVAVLISFFAPKEGHPIAAIYWCPLSILLMINVLSAKMGGGKIYDLIIGIGKISFPIFMTHQIVIRYVRIVCDHVGLNNSFLLIAITIPLIFLAAWLSDNYFLRPVSLWLKERKE